MHAAARLLETLRLTFEQHGAGRSPRPPAYALRTLDDGQAVVGLRCDVGAGRVHPVGTGADHLTAVGQQVDARAEHAAQDRVAVAAAAANRREARNGLQIVGGIAGGHRLAGVLGVGNDGQWRALLNGGHHHGRQLQHSVAAFMVMAFVALGGSAETGKQQGEGRLPAQADSGSGKAVGVLHCCHPHSGQCGAVGAGPKSDQGVVGCDATHGRWPQGGAQTARGAASSGEGEARGLIEGQIWRGGGRAHWPLGGALVGLAGR